MKKHISRKRRLNDRLDNADTAERANEPRREQDGDEDEESSPSQISASPSRNPNTVSASTAQQGYPPGVPSNNPPIQGLLESPSAAASSLTAERVLRIQTLKTMLLQERHQILSGQLARQRLLPAAAFAPSSVLPPSLTGASAVSQSSLTPEQALTAESLFLGLLNQQGDPRMRQVPLLGASAAGLAAGGLLPYGHQGQYPYGFDVPVGSESILSEISRLSAAAGDVAPTGSAARRSSIPPAAAGGGTPQLNLPHLPSPLRQHSWLADSTALASLLGATGIRSLGDRNTAMAGLPDELSRIAGERRDSVGASSDIRLTAAQLASDRGSINSATTNQLNLLSQQSSRISDQQKEEWMKSMTGSLGNRGVGNSDLSGVLPKIQQGKEGGPSSDRDSVLSLLTKKQPQKEVKVEAPSPAESAGNKKKKPRDDDMYAQIGMVGPWSMSSAGLLGDMMLSKEDIADTTTKKGRQRKRTKKSQKPKRPLSAYNIFFKEERTRIMASVSPAIANVGEENDDTTSSSHRRERGAGDEQLSQESAGPRNTPSSAIADDENEAARDQQKPTSTLQQDDGPKVAVKGGSITSTRSDEKNMAKEAPPEPGGSSECDTVDRRPGFQELAKTIGERWHSLPKDQLERYKALAAEDMARYRNEMAVYESSSAARSAPFSDTFLENPPKSP